MRKPEVAARFMRRTGCVSFFGKKTGYGLFPVTRSTFAVSCTAHLPKRQKVGWRAIAAHSSGFPKTPNMEGDVAATEPCNRKLERIGGLLRRDSFPRKAGGSCRRQFHRIRIWREFEQRRVRRCHGRSWRWRPGGIRRRSRPAPGCRDRRSRWMPSCFGCRCSP